MASRCRTLGRSRPRLAGLVPLMGKASVSHITVPVGFVVVPKALAMARLLAAASLLAILPPSSSRFCPPAPYCYHPLPGRHPTAHHWLAPYCYSPAGTILLLTGWHHTATHRLTPYCYSPAGTLLLILVGWHHLCPVAQLAIYPSDRLAPPRLRLVVVSRWLPGFVQPLGSM